MKIAYFGCNQKCHSAKTTGDFCKKNDIDFHFFNIADLAFYNGILSKDLTPLDLHKIDGAIIRCHGKITNGVHTTYPIATYQLNKILHDRSISTINGSFYTTNPFFDKFSQSLFFFTNAIPTIPTLHVVSPKILCEENVPWSFPIILKEVDGSFGLSVYKINTFEQLDSWMNEHSKKIFILQKYIPNTCDYRVIVCGGKSLGIMKRSSISDGWKHNFSQGATIEKHSNSRMERFAEGVAHKLKCDYVGIDIIIDENGNFLVIEINLSANFNGFERVHYPYIVAKNLIRTLVQKNIY